MTEIEQTLMNALKNAVERGVPLEKAKESFLNAGYAAEIVNIAADKVKGTVPQIREEAVFQEDKLPGETDSKSSPVTPKVVIPQKKPAKSNSKKIALILLFLLLLAIIGGVLWVFKDSIL